MMVDVVVVERVREMREGNRGVWVGVTDGGALSILKLQF